MQKLFRFTFQTHCADLGHTIQVMQNQRIVRHHSRRVPSQSRSVHPSARRATEGSPARERWEAIVQEIGGVASGRRFSRRVLFAPGVRE
jgi:hypothetical protein